MAASRATRASPRGVRRRRCGKGVTRRGPGRGRAAPLAAHSLDGHGRRATISGHTDVEWLGHAAPTRQPLTHTKRGRAPRTRAGPPQAAVPNSYPLIDVLRWGATVPPVPGPRSRNDLGHHRTREASPSPPYRLADLEGRTRENSGPITQERGVEGGGTISVVGRRRVAKGESMNVKEGFRLDSEVCGRCELSGQGGTEVEMGRGERVRRHYRYAFERGT